MTNAVPSSACGWPPVERACARCGEVVDAYSGGRYAVVLMHEGWRWSWRCGGCVPPTKRSARQQGVKWRESLEGIV